MAVILIWWSPRTGKTSLWKIFQNNGYKHLEFDMFKFFIKKCVKDSESINKIWNYKSPSIWENSNSVEVIKKHYINTAELLKDGFDNVLDNIELNSNILIESTYLLPKHLFLIKNKWPDIQIYCTWFRDYSDAKKWILKWLIDNPEDWINKIWENNINKTIEVFSLFSSWIKEECTKYNICFIPYEIPREIWLKQTYDIINNNYNLELI